MACHTVEATNALLDEAIAKLRELDQWALEDHQHALNHDARDTARDDMRRSNKIFAAMQALEECKR